MAGISEFHRRTAADIARVGRTIVGVGAGEDTPAFAYTIGNHLHRIARFRPCPLPELLVIGTYQGSFLNLLSRLMIGRSAAFEDGEQVQMLGGRYPVRIIRANGTARTDYAIQAGRYFGTEEFEVMQVLMPDLDGVFPGEPGCQSPFRDVPVLRVT
jgi:hypothetical protein